MRNKIFMWPLLMGLCATAQVKVGKNSTTINSSSILELESTDAGFRLPQMTTVQRTDIIGPTAGLEVFDTSTKTVWVYNGTAWEDYGASTTFSNGLTATPSGNLKLGGAITEPTTISGLSSTNKLAISGTGVDSINFDSNTISVDATNNRVGIGTVAPGYPLEVAGEARVTRLISNGGGDISSSVAIGDSSLGATMTGTENVAIGTNSMRTPGVTSSGNIAIGTFTLRLNNGNNNTIVGNRAAFGSYDIVSTTAIGTNSMYNMASGTTNTAIGMMSGFDITSGSNNIVLGASKTGITTGSGNVVVGNSITTLPTTLTNNIVLADGAGNQRIRVDATGKVGIGTITPASKLEVDGAVTNKSSISDTDLNIDYAASNLAFTTASAGAITLTNIKDGGTYTLNIRGTTSGTATFTVPSGFTVKTVNNGVTTAGKETIYTFLVLGTNVYVYMITGI